MWIKNEDGNLVNLSLAMHIYYSLSDKCILALFPDDGDSYNRDKGNEIILSGSMSEDQAKALMDGWVEKLNHNEEDKVVQIDIA